MDGSRFPLSVPEPLGLDGVHIWHASLDTVAWGSQDTDRYLSAEEKNRAKHFVFARDRRRYVLGRAVLRMLLGRCLGVQPEEISFRYNSYGKPELQGSDISFNMSESSGRVVVAITRNRRVGVDIEQIRDIPQMLQVRRRFFSKSENELLRAYSGSLQKEKFFEIWTRKEALIKAVGEGLNIPLESFDVSGSVEEGIHFIRLERDSTIGGGWGICNLDVESEYAAAVAVELPCPLPPQVHDFS